jgi:hypothetical protein
MKLIISRTYQKNETIGTMMVMDGERPMYKAKCIELSDNGNQHNTSCIPEGIYDCEKYDRPEGKGMSFHVLNVPNRDSILIHKGNYASGSHKDTLGCILPGSYFTDLNADGFVDIAESTKTMNELLEILPDKFKLIIRL